MGLIDFMKDAGEKLFGRGQAQAATPSGAANAAQANSAAGDAILNYVKAQNLSATGLTVTYDGASSTVTGWCSGARRSWCTGGGTGCSRSRSASGRALWSGRSPRR